MTDLRQKIAVAPEATAGGPADPSDPALSDVSAPPLWWLRAGVAGAQLHQLDPAHPGKTRCRLTAAGRFRPASPVELRTHRRCRICAPPPPPKPRKARRG